jgi:quercetin dioxygenase-like cupin family protein
LRISSRRDDKGDPDLGGDMPTLVGFGTFAALVEEQISEKISRRILSGDQGMLVWWSIGAGVHVEPHSHANEQIVWMLKGKMEFHLGGEQRVCGPGDAVVIPGGTEHEAWFREDTEVIDFFAPPRDNFLLGALLHERRLNSSLRLLTDRAHVQFAPRGAPRCERGSSLESKHRCRLGGDCANRFRPPRADDHSVTSN